MTYVTCSNVDCIHCNQSDWRCGCDIISIGEEYFAGCDSYESYRNNPEYSELFFICVKTADGKKAKAVKYGKRIEYRDLVFFTIERVNECGDYALTEEQSGLYAGTYRQLEERYDRISEQIPAHPKVKDLPLAKRDGNKYILEAPTEARS